MNLQHWPRIIGMAMVIAACAVIGWAPLAQAMPQPAPSGPTLTIIEPSGERTVLKAKVPPGTDQEIVAKVASWECWLYNLRLPFIVEKTPGDSEVAVSATWECNSSGRLELTVGVESRFITQSWERMATEDWGAPSPGIIARGATSSDTPCLQIKGGDWRGVARPRFIFNASEGPLPFDFGWHYSQPYRPTGSCSDAIG